MDCVVCRFMAVRTGILMRNWWWWWRVLGEEGEGDDLDIIIGTMERDKICLEDGVWKM